MTLRTKVLLSLIKIIITLGVREGNEINFIEKQAFEKYRKNYRFTSTSKWSEELFNSGFFFQSD
jgi:hypothetical protein